MNRRGLRSRRVIRARLLWGLSPVWSVVLQVMSSAGAPPMITYTDVFTSGTEGYHSFRIPAIAVAPDGTLLALAEGRRDSQTDPGGGDINLVYKTSADGGSTWSALQVFDDPGELWGASNPTPVVDHGVGRIWVLYNRWEPGYGTRDSQPGTDNNQAWVRYSDDNGVSWSDPVDITTQARDYDNWGAMFFGPGGAVQASGGRLLVPAARKPGGTSDLSTMRSYALYSDDGGASWQRGELLDVSTNENQLVELADGGVLTDARQWTGTSHRWNATSTDGGETWSDATPGETVTPVATAIERYTLVSGGDDENRILWTGPRGDGGHPRSNLEIRVSYDEALTFPKTKPISSGFAAYSDLAILGDGRVGVLWERGETANYEYITFTSLTGAYLEPPPPPGLAAYEGYDYPAGPLGNGAGGTGWNGTWTAGADLSGASTASVVDGSLDPPGFPFDVEGRQVHLSGDAMARDFDHPLDLDANDTYYVSLLARRTDTSDESSQESLDVLLLGGLSEEIAFGVGSAEHFYISRLGEVVTTPPDALDIATTYFLAAKIVAQDGSLPSNSDQVLLKAFAPGDEIPPGDEAVDWTVVGSTNENSGATLDRLLIRGAANADWYVDELRVGGDWADVVSGIPEPSSAGLLGAAALMGALLLAGRNPGRSRPKRRQTS